MCQLENVNIKEKAFNFLKAFFKLSNYLIGTLSN